MTKEPKSHPRWRMFTVDQIAEADQVSTRTVRRWLASGQLRYLKLWPLVRIPGDEHEAFLAKHRGL